MNNQVYIDLLGEAVRTYASNQCLHIKRKGVYTSWTYHTFHEDLNRLSGLLKKHGLKRGVNAVVIGENSPEWVIAYHAIILTGACTVPVDPNIPPEEIESIVSTTQARVIFCSKVYLGLFRDLKKRLNCIDLIIILDIEGEEPESRFDQFISHGNREKDAFSTSFKPDDPMVIIFTSGTTGKAKGVVLTQKNFTSVCRHAVPRMKINSNDTVCAVLPLHHVFGCAASIVAPLSTGMDIVCVPFVKGPLILEALKDKEVTFLPAVPKMLQLFYDSIMHNVKKKGPAVQTVFNGLKTISATFGDTLGEGFKRKLFSSVHKGFGGKLRLVISGGAALSKTYWAGFRQMGFTIVEGYGLTETFGPICVCPGEKAKLGSVGPVLPDNEILIDAPDGNGIGEVLLRGNCVFAGYYENDTLSREVIDDEGWFHTGDLGKLDKEGFLFLSGRKKDMIVLDNGKNVYPEELEDFYGTSALIEEIGVFGAEKNGNAIVAAVIVPEQSVRKRQSIRQATDLIFDELIRLGKNLPVYRRITDFAVVYTQLPRTTTRKLKKNDLHKLYHSIKRKTGARRHAEEQLSVIEMAMMESDEFHGVAEEILEIVPKTDRSIINPRSHLEIDIGLDSLDRLELLNLIEKRFSITIREDVFDKMETMADIISLIRESLEHPKDTSVEDTLGLKERILADTTLEIHAVAEKKPFISSFIQNIISKKYHLESNDLLSIFPEQSPCVFAANHIHQNDTIYLLASLPAPVRRNTVFLGDRETRKYPKIPFMFYTSQMVPLEKEDDSLEMIKVSLALLRRGKNLIVFPEGMIPKPPAIAPFKSAVGLLMRETDIPVIPVRMMVSGSGKQSILFGKPVTCKEISARKIIPDDQLSVEAITEVIRKMVIDLPLQ